LSAPRAGPARPALRNWQLFAIAVFVWGTTWHAIVYQLAQTTPEFGVALRFSAAGAGVLAWSAWRGERLRFSAREHARLALQGIFMYSVSYLCVYHAEQYVPSGLVAVGYSASPLILGVAAWALWRTPLTPRFLLGGVLGAAGVALIFWPEFTRTRGDASTSLGAAFTVGAVLLSAVGSLIASRNKTSGLPFWPALGYGMAYSAVLSWAFVLASGQPMRWPVAPSWWWSFAYLTAFGSVAAFAAYLSLQQRLGPGPASTISVATPVVALAVSSAFEGYRPDLWTGAGVVLAIAGHLLILGLGFGHVTATAPE
jgi:drug/metabolite transporter (DMT)-like permease